MTGNQPQPAETPHDEGNPWALPENEWWHDTAVPPEPPAAGPPVTARARDLTDHLIDRPVEQPAATTGELMIIAPAARPPSEAPSARPLSETPSARPLSETPSARPLSETPSAAEGRAAEVLAAPEVEERLANSPFWMSEEERDAADPEPAARHRPMPADRPLAPLLYLILLSLVAAFFGWVSAEPFWLAVGHGDRGYATTTRCHGSGLTQRCIGQFAADGFSVTTVTLLGVDGDGRQPGAVTPARMVSPGSDQAYTASDGSLMHLRWGLGFLLVLVCGYGIAETTGARRLPSRPARRGATIASFLGPILMLGGFLVAAY
ncbi:hypothetical protein Q0Z83_094720 [Actinoplanes sichuanensis]|uniref:Uncharacterized protein n=1 Tax=Actinoplanes sichuanensis TaxID=512349 RepID=A0ABW4ARD4_9ACTN|nr:hypothetical protein [Actinoplanes sichuanensis]BEL11281.1 hypothetical protein Q0Z83_094720 [Actinoplanes sichuanensis]